MDLSLNSPHELVADDDIVMKGPGKLFEESWFFGNLLQTRNSKSKMMARSLSDPNTRTSSSSSSSSSSYVETYRSIKKAPSMPSALKGSDLSVRRNTSSSKSLDSEDEELEFSMGELIRQASVMTCSGSNSSSFSPPHKTAATSSTSSITRQRSLCKYEANIVNTEVGSRDVIIPQVPTKQVQPQKSLANSLKSQELQGFKDLGFEFDPNEKASAMDDIRETNTKRSSYYVRRWDQPIAKWGAKRSLTSSELMKERIKFWARAVAYNVRQEC